MSIHRRNGAAEPGVDWTARAAETFVFDFPSSLEFVCRPAWEPGAPRSTGTIMVMIDGPLWKLWAHDRDSGESLFVSGTTLEAALRSLEGHLTEGSGEWRPDKGSSGGPPRKRS